MAPESRARTYCLRDICPNPTAVNFFEKKTVVNLGLEKKRKTTLRTVYFFLHPIYATKSNTTCLCRFWFTQLWNKWNWTWMKPNSIEKLRFCSKKNKIFRNHYIAIIEIQRTKNTKSKERCDMTSSTTGTSRFHASQS